MQNRLSRDFFLKDTLTVARELLGKQLVRVIDNKQIVTKIVETEAYIGPEDKGAHAYGGKKTARNEIMFGLGGYSYVYLIYGMYYCFNIVTEVINKPAAVLIRGVEPVSELNTIAVNRYNTSYNVLSKAQVHNLTSGPGKLCKALIIDKHLNAVDMCESTSLFVCDADEASFEICTSPRIGIDYAEEYAEVPWRFYIKDNPFVSKVKFKKVSDE